MKRSVMARPNRALRSLRRGGLSLLSLVLLGGFAACNALDRLLEVELSGEIEAKDAETPAKAGALVAGGITAFNCALLSQIFWGGQLGDEFIGPFVAWLESRTFQGEPSSTGAWSADCGSAWNDVARARALNDRALELLEGWTDAEVEDRVGLIARAATYAGYSHLLLGERYCTATIDGGPEIESSEVFQRAEARFSRAIEIAGAAGDDEFLHLARLGRARARLNLGRPAEARTDAALVPEGFVKLARYPGTSAGKNENQVHIRMDVLRSVTVGELYRDFGYEGVADPRVSVIDTGLLTDRGGLAHWRATKYPDVTSPIRMGSWEEAQLIVAEAAVVAGELPTAVAIINRLHATSGLPVFDSDDPDEVMDLIVYNRRAELFLEGQHIGDYRRLELPFVPSPGTPFFDGSGLMYGTHRCWPLPASERASNSNIN